MLLNLSQCFFLNSIFVLPSKRKKSFPFTQFCMERCSSIKSKVNKLCEKTNIFSFTDSHSANMANKSTIFAEYSIFPISSGQSGFHQSSLMASFPIFALWASAYKYENIFKILLFWNLQIYLRLGTGSDCWDCDAWLSSISSWSCSSNELFSLPISLYRSNLGCAHMARRLLQSLNKVAEVKSFLASVLALLFCLLWVSVARSLRASISWMYRYEK